MPYTYNYILYICVSVTRVAYIVKEVASFWVDRSNEHGHPPPTELIICIILSQCKIMYVVIFINYM